MNNKELNCPFCNKQPRTTIMGPDNEWKCGNPDCPIYDVKMSATAWNTRIGGGSDMNDSLASEQHRQLRSDIGALVFDATIPKTECLKRITEIELMLSRMRIALENKQ